MDAQSLDGIIIGIDRIESLINLPNGFAKCTFHSENKLIYTSEEDLHEKEITYCLNYKNGLLYKVTKTTIYHRTETIYNAKDIIDTQRTDLIKQLGRPSYSDNYFMYWNFSNTKATFSFSTSIKPGTTQIGHSEISLELINPNEPPAKNITISPIKINSGTGSGFIITTNGIIVTAYHVVEKVNGIDILVNHNGDIKTYKAKVLISDKTNDLSLLKIDDSNFTKFPNLPYAINTKILDIGSKVFTLGYPLSSILGEEIKLTDGLISSKTGYQGDIVTYQISAPIQPGNSGGPLFDQNGNIVGITNAGVPDAQNVGYAIKTSYLKNLLDVAPETISLPTQNNISGLSFTEKIKRLTPYVVLIKVY